MKHFPFILALILSLFGSLVFIASAQNYVPLAPLPGTFTGTEATPKTDMTTYLSGAIKLLLAIGASLAILMTVIGGTQYVAAGISPDAKSNAKSMIANSFLGLTLMLVSYLILNSINPKLVQFDLSLKKTEMGITNIDVVTCPSDYSNADGLFITDPLALRMENGDKVLWTASEPRFQPNLDKLKTEVDKFRDLLIDREIALEVNSAYRPYAYQKHLYVIYRLWVKEGLKDCDDPIFANIKTLVGDEYRKHGLGSLVANPDTNPSPHTKGRGVDLSFSSSNGNITPQMAAYFLNSPTPSGINISWQAITGDEAHFNLLNPPYTGQ